MVKIILLVLGEMGMEKVQMHVVETYLDQNCESEIAEVVRNRMEGYKAMRVGAKAPDLTAEDIHGSTYQLSGQKHDYLLVLFWASTCEHCRDMLAQLNSWYQSQNQLDLEVVAISLDESKQNFESYTENLKPHWIHLHDPQNWEGEPAVAYSIYATPSLFLLDRERKILARPATYSQFLQALKDLSP